MSNVKDYSEYSKHSFVSFIMQTCKASEGDLRGWLRKVLPRYGFTIQEDSYVSERAKKNEKEYGKVHNMLCVRGKNPRVCLVAHTDVCRDHVGKSSYSSSSWSGSIYTGEYMDDDEAAAWMKHFQNKEAKNSSNGDGSTALVTTTSSSSNSISKIEAPLVADPVIKKMSIDGREEFVIQDRDCKVQVGGDDRLGVAINTWIALNTQYDMGLLFTTDEEIGLKSAEKCSFEDLKKFDLLVQTDRGNHSNELVLKIAGVQLCSYMTAVKLLEIALDLGLPRKPVQGMGTDVLPLRRNKFAANCVNMTCGYHNSYSASPNEYINIRESEECMKYVSSIIKSYDLESVGISYSTENNLVK